MECYSATENNEIMPFAATWMDLKIITLSEVSQRKTNTMCYHLYVESKIWHKWIYLKNRSRVTDIYCYQREKLQGEAGVRADKLGVWD